MSERRTRPPGRDVTHRFDLGDASDFADGPTVLPAPWPPGPDPDFRTGTMLRIERAILPSKSAANLEPSDSAQATVRFSREDVQALIAVRMQTTRAAAKPAEVDFETAALPPRPIPRAAGTTPPRDVRLLVAYRLHALQLALAFALGVLTALIAAG